MRLLSSKSGSQRSLFVLSMMCLGLAFLYIPIAVLILYSFNDSRLVMVWGGFSFRWYKVLFSSPEVLEAFILSLKIAVINATVATSLGVLAAIVMVRFVKFKGRVLFNGMIVAPLVMPEVITGVSLLMFFIIINNLIGWPSERGLTTITIAHITFSMAYVAVIVQSRLIGMNIDIEEAASDLGAKPIRVLFDITLPQLVPAIISGWLLAFTLSLDDLVIANFVSGPGSTTLPMLIYSKVRLGLKPDVNALATLMILTVALSVGLALYLTMRSHKRNRLYK